jgi:2-oxoisovalerate dehydrogenase E1 component
MLVSRALDRIEEEELVPQGLVTYQFSSRGHDLVQTLLGEHITDPNDAATVYYRSRPFVLTQGLSPEEALLSTMGRSGGISEGRDIGVVHNLPRRDRGTVLPTSGDVGAQFTPAIGWAQAITYRSQHLGMTEWDNAIAVALAGDAACATNGFWSALVIATTLDLPYLFFIEDNGYGISVTGDLQTPGGSIARNLQSFRGLNILSGDGTDPATAAHLIADATSHVRKRKGPTLLHLSVPRLSGHSFADNQAYKPEDLVADEEGRDPLPKLQKYLAETGVLTLKAWKELEKQAESEVRDAAARARESTHPDTADVTSYLFYEPGKPQTQGGVLSDLGEEKWSAGANGNDVPAPEGPRMNMVDAIRRTLEQELANSDRMLLFGEDVGMKGGVHGATLDLQKKFGDSRVFDTSLNEEGIIGRSVGMALAGLMPVPEIQFRKYADPAHEQITDCGTIRWRTAGKFAAPIVIRMPVGFGKKTGDPWHSVSGEALYAHLVGWKIAVPSNAEDAVGLLRSSIRGNDPVMFFEHRALLDTREGRKPWPGDDFVVPFGSARRLREGKGCTIVSWGAMVHRAVEAVENVGVDADVIDLRTIVPWDREMVFDSVRRTGRLLVVHEDGLTCGFGGDIVASVSDELFTSLDAPVMRVATPDIPVPYNPELMDAVVPTVTTISDALNRLMQF